METSGPGQSLSVCGVEGDESAALRAHARHLTGVLTLPARWNNQPPRSLVGILFEALESIMPLDLAYVSAHGVTGAASPWVEMLRVEREAADDHLTESRPRLAPCVEAAESPAVTMITWRTPPGLRVVRLPVRAGSRDGVALFGSQQPDFPTASQDTLLHAATELASIGLQNVWLTAERAAVVQARDEFLATLGHELRNPLAPIVTALRLIAQRGGPAITRELEIMDRQVSQLRGLVDDLLDVSRATQGKVALNKQPLELAEVVGPALEEVTPLIESRAHRLRLDVPSQGLLIEGDPRRLTQVVANLLTNAAKYTDRDGQIDVVAARREAAIELSVKDNGLGIHQDLLPSLFDIFVQGRRTARRTEGLGIGLALVKQLVELHGGSVVARSDGPGKGSEFIVRLPISTADGRRSPETGHRRHVD